MFGQEIIGAYLVMKVVMLLKVVSVMQILMPKQKFSRAKLQDWILLLILK
jgi:hypothetical protein